MSVIEQAVPDGYKLTEVGVIPNDWEVNEVSEAFEICNTLRFPLSAKVRESMAGEYPYYGPTRIQDYINEYRADGEYALIGEDGDHFLKFETVPQTQLAKGKFNVNNHAHMIKGKIATAEWFYLFFRHREITSHLSRQGAGRYKLNKATLEQLPCAIPPKEEQTAIANTLSDVDALLNELEKLITKKQATKTATMQQLLTGKTRLPQFANFTEGEKQGQTKGTKPSELGEIPEDWDVLLMDEVTDSLSSGATPFRGNSSFYKGNNRWITSGELKYGVINDTIEKISDEAIKRANLKVHQPGTFLMAITGLEAAGTRGSCGIVGMPATTNQSCMAIYPNKKLKSSYLFHWYVYNGEELALKYCQGTKQLSYTAGLLKTIPVLVPRNTDEQTIIATNLSDMDSEIQALEQRLAKTRQIKQGMMQELLTGRTRLPFKKES
ncbi:restriction endonuclease subunit S [Vibrio splendidus]